MRPETIAKGWTHGYPFYCGVTVTSVAVRLPRHRYGVKKSPRRLACQWIKACGPHIRILPVETVTEGAYWRNRESFWIAHLKSLVPICANGNNGGGGVDYDEHLRAKETRRLDLTRKALAAAEETMMRYADDTKAMRIWVAQQFSRPPY